MLKIFDHYIMKNLAIATLFIAITLAVIILMTQSLRFLELIINAGASSSAFWILSFLALPRFFEIILPIAIMAACLFVYNRMAGDSEIVVVRSAGYSPARIARPAFILGIIVALLLLYITMWMAPVSLAKMQKMRQVVKTQYSTLIFQEGVFNPIGRYITVFVDKRNSKGELEGLLIHDSRPSNPEPVTVIAERGVVVATDEGQQVLVFEGSRQDFNKKTGALNRLDFSRYSIDLPESEAVRSRWKEPDERTILELIYYDVNDGRDAKHQDDFFVEIHRRISSVFIPLSYIAVVLSCLLLGESNRRGQMKRVILAVILVIAIQGLSLSVTNYAFKNQAGILLMYLVALMPFVIGYLALQNIIQIPNFKSKEISGRRA